MEGFLAQLRSEWKATERRIWKRIQAGRNDGAQNKAGADREEESLRSLIEGQYSTTLRDYQNSLAILQVKNKRLLVIRREQGLLEEIIENLTRTRASDVERQWLEEESWAEVQQRVEEASLEFAKDLENRKSETGAQIRKVDTESSFG